VLERDVLAARVADYEPGMLDTLIASGEVVWSGVEPLGDRDGRIALYLTDHFARLGPSGSLMAVEGRAGDILTYLRSHGASFFGAVHEGTGGGFPGETVGALWDLVWKGLVTNDTLHALRALVWGSAAPARRTRRTAFRSRRQVPPTAEGRWVLVQSPGPSRSVTEWSSALSHQLLARHGIVTRETAASESVAGGFSAVYQVLKAMEEAGRVRRGYFVAGLGGAQFAMPAALDLLRSLRDAPGEGTEGANVQRTHVVSATDPACPYGAMVEWPSAGWADEIAHAEGRGPTRTVGSLVILVDGHAAAYMRRGERELLLLGAATEPSRSTMTREAARALARMSRSRDEGRQGLLIADIDGVAATTHPAARLFVDAGFVASAMGLQLRPVPRRSNSEHEREHEPRSEKRDV
jgi:ATP-dependent Lhr-like helicase